MEAKPKRALQPSRAVDRRRERKAARAFLLALLDSGPVPVADVRSRARAARITLNDLRMAWQDLRCELVRSGFGPGGYWSWRLPAA